MQVNKIVILGGGSSGWMMAYALRKFCPEIEVELVESQKIGTIGVGESTIPYFTNFVLKFLDLDENELLRECDGTFKVSIRFNQFDQLKSDSVVYHPFWGGKFWNSTWGEDIPIDTWAELKCAYPDLNPIHFYRAFFIAVHMAEQNRFEHGSLDAYGYNLDAGKFGEYLKKKCIDRKVKHTLGEVEHVLLDERGSIHALQLSQGEKVEGDFFVDCSGFRALLIHQTLQVPFRDFSRYLINDRAVVTRIPYDENRIEEELQTITDGTALSSGWVWNVPLWSRSGTGYVHSSQFISEENAEQEFREYLANRFDENRAREAEVRFVPFRVGLYEKYWKKNCLAVPLAAGFIEPLESTGLAYSAFVIKEFVEMLEKRNGFVTNIDRSGFNDHIMKDKYEDIFEFILLHFALTKRDDSAYWRFYQDELELPETLGRIVEEMRTNGTTPLISQRTLFVPCSWKLIMLGYENMFRDFREMLNIKKLDDRALNILQGTMEKYLKFYQDRGSHLAGVVSKMPTHTQYLKEHIHGSREEFLNRL